MTDSDFVTLHSLRKASTYERITTKEDALRKVAWENGFIRELVIAARKGALGRKTPRGSCKKLFHRESANGYRGKESK